MERIGRVSRVRPCTDETAAEAAAIEEFGLDEEQWKRLVVRERD
jgi:hypothetical protein